MHLVSQKDMSAPADPDSRAGIQDQAHVQAIAHLTDAHDGDRVYRNRYLRWTGLHLVQFWLIAPLFLALQTGLPYAGLSPLDVTLTALSITALVMLGVTLITRLQVDHALGQYFRRLRSRTELAMERMGRDDRELMTDGVKEVIFEWRYISEVLRTKDWAGISLVTGTALSLAGALTGLAFSLELIGWLAAPEVEELLPAGLAFLLLAHGLSGIALGVKVFRSRCFTDRGFDPSVAVAARMDDLLAEVKDLRRAGIVAKAA